MTNIDDAVAAAPGARVSPRIPTLFGRAARMRCPNCGGDRLPERWMKLKLKCGSCGMRTERGEEDYFLGGMMLNIVLAEGLLVVAALILAAATWPDVPWDLMLWGGLVLMVIAPFLFYPLSLCLWIAADLMVRPLTAGELEWHRASSAGEFRKQRDR
ncbi:MAG TPA: DUF983 domain-containing protein [Longimicrobium sp.]|jgi:uncharacterized protein (DUF983 family)|uniref:DUF983 domain-containing protein n=1 Tax=Longimicrobium sp. TaxID=2029185 RepID=UPI002ED7A9B6